MRIGNWLGLWFVLLSLAAQASPTGETVELHLQVDPSNCEVRFADERDRQPASSPLRVRPQRWSNQATLKLVLWAPGYQEAPVTVTEDSIVPDPDGGYRWPASGRFQLTAAGWGPALKQKALTYLPLGLGGLALLLAWRKRGPRPVIGSSPTPGGAAPESTLANRSHDFGDYILLRELGAGGMATVYLAQSKRGREQVALKVMQAHVAKDPDFRERFLREYLVCRDLLHPGIVEVRAGGEWRGQLFLAMEFVSGSPLTERLRRKDLTIEEAGRILGLVLEALIYAHGKQVVHRDLKPDNIMVTKAGVKVMDFGLARRTDLARVTQTGTALGTPAYMPPEQLTAGIFDPRSDQYCLGVIAYEMFCGKRPFTADNAMDMAMAHVTDTPPPPTRPDGSPLPDSIARLIMKLMSKDPMQRFPTTTEARDALRLALEDSQAGSDWASPERSTVRTLDLRGAQSPVVNPDGPTVGLRANSPDQTQDVRGGVGDATEGLHPTLNLRGTADPEATGAFQAQRVADSDTTGAFQAQTDPGATGAFQARTDPNAGGTSQAQTDPQATGAFRVDPGAQAKSGQGLDPDATGAFQALPPADPNP